MPRLKSPPLAKRPDDSGDDDDDEEEYGEQSFESFTSPTSKQPTAVTPTSILKKKSSTADLTENDGITITKTASRTVLVAEAEMAGEKDDEFQSDKNENAASTKSLEGIDGMDLETFMQKVTKKKGGDDSATNANDPSLRPLEGVSPKKNSADMALGLRLGYDAEADNADGDGDGDQAPQSGRDKKKKRAMFRFQGEDDDADRAGSDVGDRTLHASRAGAMAANKGKWGGLRVGFGDSRLGIPANKADPTGKGAKPAQTIVIQKPKHVAKGPISPEQYAYYASLLSRKQANDEGDDGEGAAEGGDDADRNSGHRDPLPGVMPSDEDNARRVDALLNELLPHRAGKDAGKASVSQPKKASLLQEQQQQQQQQQQQRRGKVPSITSAESSSQREMHHYGLVHPNPNHNPNPNPTHHYGLGAPRSMPLADDDRDADQTNARYQQSLESQITALKKDLKARDDRCSRLTEHSMLLSNHCDNLKVRS